MLFWIALVGLGVLGAWLVVLPALRAKPVVDEARQALNVKIFNQRLAELEEDKKTGRVDDEDYQALKVELERNFLNDMSQAETEGQVASGRSRWIMLIMVLFVPVASLVIYKTTGFRDVFPEWIQTQANVDPLIDRMVEGKLKSEDLKDTPMDDFVYSLQRRAQHDHDNAQLWFVLGNTYLQLQVGDVNERARLIDSGAKALRRAYYLERNNVEYALSYAQMLINQNQGKLDFESRKILNALLEEQPDLPSAVMMLAMASYQSGEYQAAIDGWQKLLQMGQGKSGHGKAEQILKRSIAQAKIKLGGQATVEPKQGLKITVSVDEKAKADLGKGFLMVYAQAEVGPPMPLAVKKIPLPASFPLDVSLSDADAMMEAMKISQFEKVKLTARVSPTGSAMKATGEWIGLLEGVETTKKHDVLHILIDRQIP